MQGRKTSQKVRERIVQLWKSGLRTSEIATRTGVHKQTIRNIIAEEKQLETPGL